MTKTLPLILVTLATLKAAAFAGWWDDVFEEKTVSLSAILKNPTAFRGLDVGFIVQFHQVGELDNPFYTRFEKDYYLNFSVWSDETPLWEKAAYENDFPYMFIERIAPEHADIIRARPYDRFAVVGRVTDIFKGKPWIEVKGWKKVEGAMNEPCLTHMVKGFTFKEYRKYGVAAQEFARANDKTLPAHVQFVVHKQQALCLVEGNRIGEAQQLIEACLATVPADPDLLAAKEHCALLTKTAAPVTAPSRTREALAAKITETQEPAGRTEATAPESAPEMPATEIQDTTPGTPDDGASEQRTFWNKHGQLETIRPKKTAPKPAAPSTTTATDAGTTPAAESAPSSTTTSNGH